MKSFFVSCLALAVVVALCGIAQARPGYATGAGNSCSGCHTNESVDRMDVLGDELQDIDALKGRGPLQTFLGVKPGDTVPLTMLVTNGGGDDFHFVVQLKRFEKDEATGGPPMPQDMARWAADNPGW
ncbi:MAG: hypothetical protein QGD94_10625, partial [Planctomycetia bacterium]|nr:hypothetical protein [Planctomycetia bacterium]